MSWQDELRRLDAELANGTITQHQHRKMRDELLAAASGGVAPAPVSSPLGRADGAPQWQSANPAQVPPPAATGDRPQFGGAQPVPQAQQSGAQAGAPQPVAHGPQFYGQATPQQQGTPQPQAQDAHQLQPQQQAVEHHVQAQPAQPNTQPQGTAQQGATEQGAVQPQEQLSALASEEGATQSISAQLLSTSTPTSAPSPADERATDSMRFPSIEDAPTVITNPVPPPSRPLPAMAPPPPLHTGPMPQQPMPFDPAPRLQAPEKRKPTWLFIALGVIVVVAMVAAGVWLLRDQNTGTTAATNSPTTSAASSPEAVEARLPTLPGTPSPNNGTMTVEQGIDLKLYSREEGQLMKDNGATQVVFRGSSQGPQGYLVLVIPAGSTAGAPAITKGLYEHALTAGLTTVPSGSTDAKTVTGSNSAGQMSGTWYTSGNNAVAIWVSQGLDGDPTSLSARLAQTKTALATALPPN